MSQNLDTLIEQFLAGLTPKQRKVVTERFGLKNGKRATLQEIGDELGITRERVRQIGEQAGKKLKPLAEDKAAPLLEFADTHLASVGGVRRDDHFVADTIQGFFGAKEIKYAPQKLTLLFITAGAPFYAKEDDDFYGYWYADENAKKKFLTFVKNALHFFRTNDKHALLNNKTYLAQVRDFASSHYLSISKHFGVNMFGDVGLRAWPEIEPKTVRDKAYLALKKHGKPLHFEEIAKYIAKYGIDKKPAHVQTVHNELIKDPRFVLVGRGIYALSEHGFEPGTVREVIAKLLKKHGPLSQNEVVHLVNEQRILKQNTILLSLQNRHYFKRLDDGRYHVREA